MKPLPCLLALTLLILAGPALAQTPAAAVKPIRVLIVTGVDYPAHEWR